jgi:hypothetical protein
LDLEALSRSLNNSEIQWIFNPPHAPHFGGVWERKVGAIKKALLFSLAECGKRLPTRDEFHTFLLEAAAIVNNTPLWAVSSDPNDPQPLTPNMLLTLKEADNERPLVETSAADLLAYGKRRWRRVQHLANVFWERWKTSYLTQLQARTKWTRPKPNLQPGDLVVLVEPAPRNKWPMARVEAVKTSTDGLVRSVIVSRPTIAGARSSFERPISKVVSLGL